MLTSARRWLTPGPHCDGPTSKIREEDERAHMAMMEDTDDEEAMTVDVAAPARGPRDIFAMALAKEHHAVKAQ